MSALLLAVAIGCFELSGFLNGMGHFWLSLLPIIPAGFCLSAWKERK